ncbi:DUF3565 domain-containing protein [Halothiobacillus sp. DCM-1]|uniref:DUF3565 domain-containing protein n=1 Tax=Halothiobacillus sp. DCM-1 TaxID=3112558 RepID=UPI00324705E7
MGRTLLTAPPKAILSFHRDTLGDCVARLACGHHQHTRDNPPWVDRPWVRTAAGRARMIGSLLPCVKCRDGLPPDPPPPPESCLPLTEPVDE